MIFERRGGQGETSPYKQIFQIPAEEEQGIAVRIKPEAVLYDIDQTIQLFPHIRVPGAQIDLFYPGEVT